MKVDSNKPYSLIYSLFEHPQIGFIIEPFVVQLNENGNFTLTHQRIFSRTLSYFSAQIETSDKDLIKILDDFDNEYITKRFFKGTKKIRPTEFFQKHCTTEMIELYIRPFVEIRMLKALDKLRDKPFFLYQHNNPAGRPINIAQHKSTVLFHFRRNQDGTRYFATIKNDGQKIEFMQHQSKIVCNDPAYLLVNGSLYNFEKEVDGKKLRPFLNKRFIQVQPSAEEKYYQEFVTKLIERFDVYAEGFEIRAEKSKGHPMIALEQHFAGHYHLILYFNYGNEAFPYTSGRKVHVTLSKEDGNYVFHRIARNPKSEKSIQHRLEELGLKFNDEGFVLPENSQYGLVEWVGKNLETLKESGISLKAENILEKYSFEPSKVDLEINRNQDWFDINAIVTFGEYSFPFIKLKIYILNGEREFVLPNGMIAVIPEAWLARYSLMFRFSKGDENIKLKQHHAGILETLMATEEQLKKPIEFNAQQVLAQGLPMNLKATLRPYQKEGYDWFYYLKNNNFGGILADDMGLGKTLQALALLLKEKELNSQLIGQDNLLSLEEDEADETIYQEPLITQLNLFSDENKKPETTQQEPKIGLSEVRKTSLIVVPSSLIFNWQNEAHKFTPGLKLITHTGQFRDKTASRFKRHDVVLTTYGILRRDLELFKGFQFHYIILDESQIIKNNSSQASQAVKQLNANHRLALSGTPVENSLNDLWTQINFVNPGLLGSQSFFNDNFAWAAEKDPDEGKRRKTFHELQQLVRPFILRRTKEQVAKDLPEKVELTVFCEMTEEQKSLYETTKSNYRNEILENIEKNGFNKSKIHILSGLTKLRQIAIHPKLIDTDFNGESGKYNDLTNKLLNVIAEGHKVLLFSQFVRQLELFKEFLDKEKVGYAMLTGELQAKERKLQVEKFQNQNEIKVFLISLKAGGLGLNLTAADYVFITDPWWNPAVQEQAINRAHRIGQTKKVFSYKFITKDSVEEKIMALQMHKKQLAKGIIDIDSSILQSIDENELQDLLA